MFHGVTPDRGARDLSPASPRCPGAAARMVGNRKKIVRKSWEIIGQSQEHVPKKPQTVRKTSTVLNLLTAPDKDLIAESLREFHIIVRGSYKILQNR